MSEKGKYMTLATLERLSTETKSQRSAINVPTSIAKLALAHRRIVIASRNLAIDKGLGNNNEFVRQVLARSGIPRTAADIYGPPTNNNHPGLASTVGVLRKNRKNGTMPLPEIVQRFAISVSALTPEATNGERSAIVLGALSSQHIRAEGTGTITAAGYPIIDLNGREIVLPLIPNTAEQEAQDWQTPYKFLDFAA